MFYRGKSVCAINQNVFNYKCDVAYWFYDVAALKKIDKYISYIFDYFFK